jgi:ATP-binding cassette subfamily B (MDR/TAP) protein 6
VEAGAAAATSSDEPPAPRTWAALFVDACAYAWPEAPLLRLRVLLCVVLLVAMRVINLAVPITYKRLVDQLAGASTSGVPGERPNFWQLLQPW